MNEPAREYEPPPTQRDVKSLTWPLAAGIAGATGLLLAGLVAWSPWDKDDRAGQGGSDIPREERIAPPPPIQAGTPYP